MRPWISRRVQYGNYANLMEELQTEGDFVNYMRMDSEMFQEILMQIAPRLTKISTSGCGLRLKAVGRQLPDVVTATATPTETSGRSDGHHSLTNGRPLAEWWPINGRRIGDGSPTTQFRQLLIGRQPPATDRPPPMTGRPPVGDHFNGHWSPTDQPPVVNRSAAVVRPISIWWTTSGGLSAVQTGRKWLSM